MQSEGSWLSSLGETLLSQPWTTLVCQLLVTAVQVNDSSFAGVQVAHLCACLFHWNCAILPGCTNIGCHKPKLDACEKENSPWKQDLAECVSKSRSRLCSSVAVEYRLSVSLELHLFLGAVSQLVTVKRWLKTQQNAAQKAVGPVHLGP